MVLSCLLIVLSASLVTSGRSRGPSHGATGGWVCASVLWPGPCWPLSRGCYLGPPWAEDTLTPHICCEQLRGSSKLVGVRAGWPASSLGPGGVLPPHRSADPHACRTLSVLVVDRPVTLGLSVLSCKGRCLPLVRQEAAESRGAARAQARWSWRLGRLLHPRLFLERGALGVLGSRAPGVRGSALETTPAPLRDLCAPVCLEGRGTGVGLG